MKLPNDGYNALDRDVQMRQVKVVYEISKVIPSNLDQLNNITYINT